MKNIKAILSIFVLSVFSSLRLFSKSYISEITYTKSGHPLFELRWFQYSGTTTDSNGKIWPNAVTIGEQMATRFAVDYWGDVIGKYAKNSFAMPVNILINREVENNASAGSSSPTSNSGISEAINNNVYVNIPANINLGTNIFLQTNYVSAYSNGSGFDATAVLIHELGHAVGINTILSGAGTRVEDVTFRYEETAFGNFLYDKNHTKLQNSDHIQTFGNTQYANTDECGVPLIYGETYFWVGQGVKNSGVYYQSENVTNVLKGATIKKYDFNVQNALPINGWEVTGFYDDDGNLAFKTAFPELSHIELEHCLMSHQNYRNYTHLIEAEIAVLQDLGYEIDRKSLFGYSEYRSGITNLYLNDNWKSDSLLAVGTHIYGSENTIKQSGNIFANGTGATGIRIDGYENNFTLNQNAQVSVNGTGGTGLRVAYGRNHNITIENGAHIEANGFDGNAVRFDFGKNLLSDAVEDRGSYIWNKGTLASDNSSIDSDGFYLNNYGALVDEFNVKGSLSGNVSAIYISENAFVRNINLLDGAEINGNILNFWNHENSLIQYNNKNELVTDLNVNPGAGNSIKINGSIIDFSSINQVLKNGNLYDETITSGSMNLNVQSGKVDVAGNICINNLNNKGTLNLNNTDYSIVKGEFKSESGSILGLGFDGTGNSAHVYANSVTVATDATLNLIPQKSFYKTDSTYIFDSLVYSNGDKTSSYSNRGIDNNSPFLNFTLDTSNSLYSKVNVSRAENVYSQFSANENEKSAGKALAFAGKYAKGDLQNVFAILDFSSADGSTIKKALPQLTAEAYNYFARNSIRQQQNLNRQVINHLVGEINFNNDKGWKLWTKSGGNFYSQKIKDNNLELKSNGINITAGADYNFENGFILGGTVCGALRFIETKESFITKGKAGGIWVGLHTFYSPEDWNGFHIEGFGRGGFEGNSIDRNINFDEYNKTNSASWISFSSGLGFGFGKDWNFGFEKCGIKFGPLGWTEYNFYSRPDISETGSGTALDVRKNTYGSLSTNVGGRINAVYNLYKSWNLNGAFLVAWRHEFINDDFYSTANFSGISETFESKNNETCNDSILFDFSLKVEKTLFNGSSFHIGAGSGFELLKKETFEFSPELTFCWNLKR